jgi:hypothetical protein
MGRVHHVTWACTRGLPERRAPAELHDPGLTEAHPAWRSQDSASAAVGGRLGTSIRLGTALIALGVAATVAAGISHWLVLLRLRRSQDVVLAQWPLSITLAFLLSVVGLAALWGVVAR